MMPDNEFFPVVNSAWIFQSSPNLFDVTSAISMLPEIAWLVNQHSKGIHVGDRVYLWESGKAACIVALATVMTEPQIMPQTQGEEQFCKVQEHFDVSKLRVRLKIDKVFTERLMRYALLSDPVLKEIAVITQPRGTNFILTSEQARLIDKLISNQSADKTQGIEGLTVTIQVYPELGKV